MASPVFALDLELDYPSIPGVGSLEEGQELDDKGEQMAFYSRYILRLVFYIVLGVCVIVFIVAGIIYITAGQKPSAIVKAKAMIQHALLGLAILVGSYSMLYLINPQLLILRVDFQEPEPVDFASTGEAAVEGEVRGYYIDPSTIALETLENAAEELHYHGLNHPDNDYDEYYRPTIDNQTPVVLEKKQGLFVKLFKAFARPVSVSAQAVETMVYRAELPLRQTEKVVEELVDLTEKVAKLLEKCKCGTGESHTEWDWKARKSGDVVKKYSIMYEGTCMGGMSEEEEGKWWNTHDKTPQNICLTRTNDCGTSRDPISGELNCDLRDIVVKHIPVDVAGEEKTIEVVFIKIKEDAPDTTTINETEWALIEWNPVGWKPGPTWAPTVAATVTGKVDVEEDVTDDAETTLALYSDAVVAQAQSIKYKRYRVELLIAQLNGLKDKYFPEQVGPVDKTLMNNAADYFVFNGKGMFENDFNAKKEEWEKQGLTVKMEPFKSANAELEKSLVVSAAPQGRFEKFVSFFVKPVSAQTQKTRIQGTRYYIITEAPKGLLPEDILSRNRLVRREAGRASLFSVLTDLSLERIQGMFQTCLTAAFGEAEYDISDDQIKSALEGALEGGAFDQFAKEIKDNIAAVVAGIGETSADLLEDRLKAACEVECGAGNKDCINECIKKNISPDFTSRTITKFLTADIDTWFGKQAKSILDGKIRDILGDDINQHLDKEMKKFYDTVFMGLLSQSLEDKIPKLKGILETKLTEVPFLDVVLGRLGEVDRFLTCKISGCCRPVQGAHECIEEVFDESAKECGISGNAASFHGVASRHQCKKEVFRNSSGKDECCEQGLRQVVDAFAEDKIKSLARQYTTQQASGVINKLKEKMPGYFPEFRMAEECHLKEGYFFRPLDAFSNQFVGGCLAVLTETKTGECIQMIPDDINHLGGGVWMNETTKFGAIKQADGSLCLDLANRPISHAERPDICRGAGYCWAKDYDLEDLDVHTGRDGSEKCRECSLIGQGFTRGEGMAGVGAGVKRLGRKFIGGLINFGEQFVSALVEVTLHTAIQYAKVWIEDTITAPLMPYFKQVMNFQNKLHGYLTASVRDVLPSPIRETLEKNLETLITDLCKKYQAAAEQCRIAGTPDADCEITFQFAAGHEYSWLKWKDASGVPQDIEFTKSSKLSQAFSEKICKLDTHLHTTLLDEIAASSDFGADIARVLNNTIKDELSHLCDVEINGKQVPCTEILEMNLAEMLFAFTPLKNILQLINGTPKQIICGEISVEWQKDGSTKLFTPSAVCGAIRSTAPAGSLLSPISLALPLINKASATYAGLSPSAQKFYQGYCPFIWSVCEKVSVSNTVTVGGVIKQILEKSCSSFGEFLEEGIIIKDEKGQDISVLLPRCSQGKCLNALPTAPALLDLQQDTSANCLPAFKSTCSGCNTAINNTIAFSLFYQAIKRDFSISGDVYPDVILPGSDMEEGRSQEGEAYQWLYIYFPDSHQDIGYVAELRNFNRNNPRPWSVLKTEVDNIGRNTVLQNIQQGIDSKVLIKTFINSFKTRTVKSVLLDIPLGIVKPMKQGEAAILKPAGRGESKNFLAKTPVNFLVRDVCGKVIYDFETTEGLKYWSLPEVSARERAGLGGAPYSMESLQSSTLAKNLEIIFHSPVADERKIPYLFCKVLQYSPAQVTGLTERLMTYIRPKQAQIMFQLIRDELKRGSRSDCDEDEVFVRSENGNRDECCDIETSACHLVGEKPPALNALLNYLYNNTPITALMDAADTLGSGQPEVKNLVDFLSTKIVNLILKQAEGREKLFQPMIDTICGELAGWCDAKIDILQEDILRVIREFIKQKPVDWIESKFNYSLIDCAGNKCSYSLSIMDWLVIKFPSLDEPYLDALGRKLGWDVGLFGIKDDVNASQKLIDASVDNMQTAIEDTLNKALIEKPAQAVNYVQMELAQLIGGETGNRIADQLTGACAEKDAGGTVFTQSACKQAGKVYRASTPSEPAECCDLGANVVCNERCRLKPDNKKCIEEIGEVQTPDGILCCFEMDAAQENCKKCRIIPAVDDAADRGCREDEIRGEIEVNGEKVSACCKLKKRITEEDAAGVIIKDTCCSTVVDCVAEQFGEHLKVLSETMAHGSLPLDTLIEE